MDLKPGELYQGLTGLISGHGGQKTGLRVLVWVLNGPGGGGWKDVRTDVWKFPPVFYRTSALWGRCPKSFDHWSVRPSVREHKSKRGKMRVLEAFWVAAPKG